MSHTGKHKDTSKSPLKKKRKSLAVDLKPKHGSPALVRDGSRTANAKNTATDVDPDATPARGGGLPPAKTKGGFTPAITTTVTMPDPTPGTAPGVDVEDAPAVDEMETDRPRPTVWTIARRNLTAGQTVRLAPHIKLKDGRIARMAAGRMRTPSPFGGRMGDHTVAWTAVVDDVHALVFGKTLQEAYQALSDRQDAATAWMGDNDSVMARLWDTLPEDERSKRQPVLETYAAEVRDALQGPPTAEGLAKAIAHHLAFVNFLPYATVPAKGVVGSKGSGEGAARTAVLALDLRVENAEKLKEETEPQRKLRVKREKAAREWAAKIEALRVVEEDDREVTAKRHRQEQLAEERRKAAVVPNAREGLWRLLAVDAAGREAHLDRVVAPARHAAFVQKVKDGRKLAEDAVKLSAEFSMEVQVVATAAKAVTDKASRKRKKPTSLTPTGRQRTTRKTTTTPKLERRRSTPGFRPPQGAMKFGQDVNSVAAGVAGLGALSQSGHQVLTDLPSDIAHLVRKIREAVSTPKLQVGTVNEVINAGKTIQGHIQAIDTLLADLEGDAIALENEAALKLGHLLHDHQATTARTYPVAVRETGFLGDDPAATAVGRLRAFVQAKARDDMAKARENAVRDGDPGRVITPFVEDEALDRLLVKVEGIHKQLGAVRKPGQNEANRWVGVAKTADVVVSFTGDRAVTVQGRAVAPNGVSGMGSHTTAWVTEVMAVERMVRRFGKNGITAHLQQETLGDLEGDLMVQLATRLPSEQLEADQLGDIFNAALEVMEAASPEDAVTAYLSFRNLLPYATVDAGNREGQGERRNGSLDELFDGYSLDDAIEQKLDELSDDNLTDSAEVLRAAATTLREVLDETEPPPPVTVPGTPVLAFDRAGVPVMITPAVPAPAEPAPPSWHSHARLKAAVENIITVLTVQADDMDSLAGGDGVDTRAEADHIRNIRYAEHTRTYNYAHGI